MSTAPSPRTPPLSLVSAVWWAAVPNACETPARFRGPQFNEDRDQNGSSTNKGDYLAIGMQGGRERVDFPCRPKFLRGWRSRFVLPFSGPEFNSRLMDGTLQPSVATFPLSY